MWEAKIRKIEVPEQLGQKVHKTPSHRKKKKKKLGTMAHSCHPKS
jgi:hypothetical protein